MGAVNMNCQYFFIERYAQMGGSVLATVFRTN